MSSTIELLPTEIIQIVLLFSGRVDNLALSVTSKYLHSITKNEHFWKNLVVLSGKYRRHPLHPRYSTYLDIYYQLTRQGNFTWCSEPTIDLGGKTNDEIRPTNTWGQYMSMSSKYAPFGLVTILSYSGQLQWNGQLLGVMPQLLTARDYDLTHENEWLTVDSHRILCVTYIDQNKNLCQFTVVGDTLVLTKPQIIRENVDFFCHSDHSRRYMAYISEGRVYLLHDDITEEVPSNKYRNETPYIVIVTVSSTNINWRLQWTVSLDILTEEGNVYVNGRREELPDSCVDIIRPELGTQIVYLLRDGRVVSKRSNLEVLAENVQEVYGLSSINTEEYGGEYLSYLKDGMLCHDYNLRGKTIEANDDDILLYSDDVTTYDDIKETVVVGKCYSCHRSIGYLSHS
jgi:hypothetical protein